MRPKCPKCGKATLDTGMTFKWVACTRMDCSWSKRIRKAAIIRLATEPRKPKTCKWTVRTQDTWNTCDGWIDYVSDYCLNCGKPVEV